MTEENKNNETPSSEKLRVGVYTCQCGGNISHTVDVDQVVKTLGKLADVVVSRTDASLCSDGGQALIENDIKELGINRVVVGACAPSLHEQTFRDASARAGLNPFLCQHICIREQDSWVHSGDKKAATDKAVRLIASGIAKARLLSPLAPITLKAEKQALVIGGGVSGLRSALDIAREGIKVVLIEKSPFLGGRMAQLESIFPTDDKPRDLLNDLIQKIISNPNISIYTQAEVTGMAGYVGNFTAQITQHSRGVSDGMAESILESCTQEAPDEFNYGLSQRKVVYRRYPGCFPNSPAVDWEFYNGEPLNVNGKSIVLKDEPRIFEVVAGAIVVATGFDPYEPRKGEYGYGELQEVVTLPQLIRIMAQVKDGEPLKWHNRLVRDVALIHCVGSRQLDGIDEPQADGQVNNYCSRVCCTASLHTAVDLRTRFPKINLFEFYQDIRTYGRGHEEIYRKAQSSMVRMLHYHGEERPEVITAPAGDKYPVLVKVKDYLTYGQEIEVPVDLVVLAVGFMPRQIDELIKLLKISRGADRFLAEVHPKLQPVETAVRGIVLAGTAQGPMNIQESQLAASAAAAKVTSLLGKGQVGIPPFVARVDEAKCTGTGACVEICPEEGAIKMQTFTENGLEVKRPVVIPANCTGCGACVGVCPNRAIDVQSWTLGQFEAMVDAITMEIPVFAEDGK